MPKRHQQKLKMSPGPADALGHRQRYPVQWEGVEERGVVVISTLVSDVITTQLSLFTFHIHCAVTVCHTPCQSLYMDILICSRKQPHAVGTTGIPALQKGNCGME